MVLAVESMDDFEFDQLGSTTDGSFPLHPFQPTSIPVEIWSKIFTMATHIPGVFDIEDYSAITAFTRDIHGICIHDLFWLSMRIKLACSRVCRYWSAIIQPLLYQYLRIESGKQACAIADALEQMGQSTDVGGKWTLRIDLYLEGEHDWSELHDEAMARIFRACENLTCFSNAFSKSNISFQDSERLVTHLAGNSKLKRLEVKLLHGTLSFIEKAFGETLEVLWLIGSPRHAFHQAGGTYFLSKLRILVVDGSILPVMELTLPSLCAYAAGESAISRPSLHCNTDLLQHIAGYSWPCMMHRSSTWSSLTILSLKCFELAYLEFAADENFKHSGLKHILIEDFANVLYDSKKTAHFKAPWGSRMNRNLKYFISRDVFPELSVVGFHLPVSYRRVLPHGRLREGKEFWISWFKTFDNLGIRLEVSRGAKERFEDKWTEVPACELIHDLILRAR